ncbi:MAG: hypothetical protein LBU91_08560 [Bacteroidales bacterium]|jgi:hypothetical protein|nr:hypothetical protein [Bacteroidales bacterium]
MLKKYFKMGSMVAIATCLAAATIFYSCGKDDKDKKDDETEQEGEYTQGWPSNATLSNWNLGGITLPSGATDAEYDVVESGESGYLSVNFKSYANNDNPFSAQFEANGWELDGEPWIEEDGSESHWDYRKGTWTAFYDWSAVRGSALFICKNCEDSY